MFASSVLKASMTEVAALAVSASTTPSPCVPSRSLSTRGAPPTTVISAAVSLVEWAKLVVGRPIPSRDRSCRARSLSREREIASDSFVDTTPLISNCRTTAAP